jgi:nucleotide-binding universal stress UspA family protein
VYQPVVPLDAFPQSVEYSAETERAAQAQAEAAVRQAAGLIREYFADVRIDVSTDVKIGAPAQIIVETAEEWKADVIVVGSHGRGYWKRALLGSVSDAVIHHAPCSVLIVRGT